MSLDQSTETNLYFAELPSDMETRPYRVLAIDPERAEVAISEDGTHFTRLDSVVRGQTRLQTAVPLANLCVRRTDAPDLDLFVHLDDAMLGNARFSRTDPPEHPEFISPV